MRSLSRQIAALVLFAAASAWAATPDAQLQKAEIAKWDSVNRGGAPDMQPFADDFVSIGYDASGGVHLTSREDWKSGAVALPRPPQPFTTGEFRFVHPDANSVIVTYVVRGPLNLRATSVWAKRSGEWRTVFYQATRTE